MCFLCGAPVRSALPVNTRRGNATCRGRLKKNGSGSEEDGSCRVSIQIGSSGRKLLQNVCGLLLPSGGAADVRYGGFLRGAPANRGGYMRC